MRTRLFIQTEKKHLGFVGGADELHVLDIKGEIRDHTNTHKQEKI